MSHNFHLKSMLLTVIFVLIGSALLTTRAAADDAAPPTEAPVISTPEASTDTDAEAAAAVPADTPAVVEPTAVPTDAPTDEIAAPVEEEISQPTDTAPPAETELAAQDASSDDLSQLPPDTEVMVLDEDGEVVPLVSQEAADIVSAGDPMWCPAGVTPGGAGCSTGTNNSSMTNLIAWMTTTNPAMAGVIWIAASYDSSVVEPITTTALTISGSTLTNMRSYPLTIKGGWTGTGTTTDPLDPSVFSGDTLSITGWQADVTLSDIEVTNVPGAASTALRIDTPNKKITLTRVKVYNNLGSGAYLTSCCATTGAVAISNSWFALNKGGMGLQVYAGGAITLNSVIASQNQDMGAYLVNSGSTASPGVTLTGLNMWSQLPGVGSYFDSSFSDNKNTGLMIYSKGAVTISNVTASGNANGWGALIDNCDYGLDACLGTGTVTLTGMNTFNGNTYTGLNVSSNGAISASNLVANSNTSGYGAWLSNEAASAAQPVTLTGSSQFKGNLEDGLNVETRGQVTLNNITASGNTQGFGAYIDNCQASDPVCRGTANVVLTGANVFEFNHYSGLVVESGGTITLSNLQVRWNAYGPGGGGAGARIDNCIVYNTTCRLFKLVTISGTSLFDGNKAGGLDVLSGGTITINNLTSSNNVGDGAYLGNNEPGSSAGITLTGTNVFAGNTENGLEVHSFGAVSLANITAMNNKGTNYNVGLYIDNAGGAAKPVTLSGTNNLSGNEEFGLQIFSAGLVTINSLTANNNGYFETDGVNHNSTGYGAEIVNTAGTASVTLSGTNIFNDNYSAGLVVTTRGAITISTITANGNFYDHYDGVDNYYGMYGVQLDNSDATTPQPVTITTSGQFNGNRYYGLYIGSKGLIKLSNITANDNLQSDGVYLDNCDYNYDPLVDACLGNGNVILSGTNVFQNNHGNGIYIDTAGTISLNSVNSSWNTGTGASLNNCHYDMDTKQCRNNGKSVTLTGTNIFNGNTWTGLEVSSGGAIILSSITANASTSRHGAQLDNRYATSVQPITFSGVNTFVSNNGSGLYLTSRGKITLTSVNASGNLSGDGAYVDNCAWDSTDHVCDGIGDIVLIGTNNFQGNYMNGLNIETAGAVTMSSVNASGNGSSGDGDGTQIDNCNFYGSSCTVLGKAVTLTGTNVFNMNWTAGLYVDSGGTISISSITASGNLYSYGAYLSNEYLGSVGNVTVAGPGVFSGNAKADGLLVYSLGVVSLTNITATNNGLDSAGWGVYIDNADGSAKAVTLAGTNNTSGNLNYGLGVYSAGVITINNLTASGSRLSGGAYLNTTYNSATVNSVVLNGTSRFESNAYKGLEIQANGMVLLNTLNANYNGDKGVQVDNTGSTSVTPRKVQLSGIGVFNENGNTGLQVASYGAINLLTTSISANNNGLGGSNGNGLDLNNCQYSSPSCTSSATVTINGVNQFNGNNRDGLSVFSGGAITINNVTSSCNGMTNHCAVSGSYTANGIYLHNMDAISPGTPPIMVNGTNVFKDNRDTGVVIYAAGPITTNNMTANYNVIGNGATLQSAASGAMGKVQLTGTNTFNSNHSEGLWVSTLGAISANNVTASYNAFGGGAILNTSNTGATLASVTLTGVNAFNSNGATGLAIYAGATITASNVSANDNVGQGAYLANFFPGFLPANITLTGVNQFSGNSSHGLYLDTQGVVSLTKITADKNSSDGLYALSAAGISIMCGSFTDNNGYGLEIALPATSSITLTGVASAGNGAADWLSPSNHVTWVRVCPLP